MRDKLQSLSYSVRKAMGLAQPNSGDFPLEYRPQIHEKQIIEFFSQEGRQFFDGKNQPAVQQNYALCFTNRCGSNWLAALFAATGLVGHADEFFNAPRFIKTCQNTKANSFTKAFHNQAHSKLEQTTGSFIAKLSWDQLFFFAKMRIIPEMMPDTRYILIHRRNVAAQALSMLVAEQTGQWASNWNSGKNGKRDLDRISDIEIQKTIDEITIKYQQFWRFFATFGIKPVEVYYEDIVEDPLREVTRLVDELDLNPDGNAWTLDESKVKLKKQSDEASNARIEKFYQSMRNHQPMKFETKEAA